MNIVAWILGVILVVGFVGAGGPKLVDAGSARRHLGYRLNEWRLIGLAELAGAAAIVIGLIARSVEYIAIAGAVGLASMMLGALMAHARVEDEGKAALPAAAMLVLSVAFVIVIALR